LRWVALAVVCLFGALMFYAEGDMSKYGDISTPANTHVSSDYITRSMKDTHTPNVVTSVLADYRGYDTLGETTVIFTAGLVCAMLMMKGKKDDQ
jgi:multicomponent Na+:H+ antiporter subunit B